jgi:glycosyltransferase involved in cell wall biosynthesis
LLGQKELTVGQQIWKEDTKLKTSQKLITWIRGNFFIPDPRKFWIKPSVRFLKSFVKKEKIDLIISTGPPHSMHVIGLKLKRALGIPWIADFRDPWTQLVYFNKLKLSPSSRKAHHKLESSVIAEADRITTVGSQLLNDFIAINHQRDPSKFRIIYNGFDQLHHARETTNEHFTICYTGRLSALQNPTNLWIALGLLVKENNTFAQHLRINLVGEIDAIVLEDIQSNQLTPYLNHKGYVSHQEAVELQQNADLLLLMLFKNHDSKGILTGKIFEYLATHHFILAFGTPGGDVDTILKETKAGVIHPFDTSIPIIKELIYQRYQLHPVNLTLDVAAINTYTRRNQCKQLATICDELVKLS